MSDFMLHEASSHFVFGFLKIVLLDNVFDNLTLLKKKYAPFPLNCLIIFEKKIFNIMHNEINMQRF
jgi:hypothetical protein